MSYKSVLWVIVALFVLFVMYFLITSFFYPDMMNRGQFGDMFGGLNALFSGLAFAGVVYAIFLQRRDLELQREELKLTREELKRTAEAQEKSERALSKQAASLKVTAQLNGKSAVLQHYNTLLELTNSAKYGIDERKFGEVKEKADSLISEINQLIEGK
jgi:uncharacterized membrane protein